VVIMPIVYAVAAILIVLAVARLTHAYMPAQGGFQKVLNIVLALIVVGVLLWLINAYIPMAGAIKGLLNFVVFVAACVGVLQAFGLWDSVVGFVRNLRHRSVSEPSEPAPQRH
jgi:hypothetical protein